MIMFSMFKEKDKQLCYYV